MFLKHFGIEENPFSNTPDPNYLFMSDQHQEALAHLRYGVQGSSGFVLLTGEVGTGKTTICRCLVEQLPKNVDLAMCLNPRLNEAELLASICDELAIKTKKLASGSIKDYMDALNKHLLKVHAQGRRTVLIIDEAQNLTPSLLELVRLLTNLETASTKLLQIILIGQSELRATMDTYEMRQLSQRITARYHLDPMTPDESSSYIRHRLRVGRLSPDLFEPAAIAEICARSAGIPRLINAICERSLLGAYATEAVRIDAALARTAALEVMGAAPPSITPRPGTPARAWAFAAVLSLFVISGTIALDQRDKEGVAAFAQATPAKQMRTDPALSPIRATAPPVKKTPAQPDKPKPASAATINTRTETEELKAVNRLIADGLVADGAVKAGAASSAPLIPNDETLTLENLFRRPDIRGGLESAITRLFQLWGKDAKSLSGLNPCDDAKASGLRCYRQKGSWANMEAVNRPALISLLNADGVRKYAVVSALTGTRATLEIDNRKIIAEAADIKPLWSGDFMVLWNPLPRLRRSLWSGMSGKDVGWLRQRLGDLLGKSGEKTDSASVNSGVFDNGLKKMVIAFQESRNLKADGIVGTLTRIQLSAAIGPPNAPALRK